MENALQEGDRGPEKAALIQLRFRTLSPAEWMGEDRARERMALFLQGGRKAWEPWPGKAQGPG